MYWAVTGFVSILDTGAHVGKRDDAFTPSGHQREYKKRKQEGLVVEYNIFIHTLVSSGSRGLEHPRHFFIVSCYYRS